MRFSKLARQATKMNVADLFRKQACIRSEHIAYVQDDIALTFGQLDGRTNKLANALLESGVGEGDRIAILSENTTEFLDLFFAAAKIGAIVAPQNWRLTNTELEHCLDLVQPKIIFVSNRFRENLVASIHGRYLDIQFGEGFENFIEAGANRDPEAEIDSEEGLLIVYTSGTTGLPKGALISQQALIARAQQYCTEFGIDHEDTFFAYSPLFHIASADLAIATLIIGGKVIPCDGLEPKMMRRLLKEEKLSNLIFFPGMVDNVLKELALMDGPIRSLKKFGALADLFPPQEIAAMTSALNKEYTNTYASTETGMAPGCGGRIPVGVAPTTFSKTESNFCRVRLVDEEDKDVADGQTGELLMRGPTLFTGYWRNDEATEEVFAGGWYHTGDLFRRNSDGTLDYIDRKKYLIKSGGENIYPAEIERVVLQNPNVAEALVVRQPDPKWGEVPVLVATCRDSNISERNLIESCENYLTNFRSTEKTDLPLR